MKIFVIIPAYNEEKYLEEVLKGVLPITRNVVYIDDGSRDKSVAIAKKYLNHVLIHDINLGKGAALKTGCEYAFGKLQADAVVIMDADNQHNPADLPRFFEKLKEGIAVVFGVRKFDSTMPLVRFLGNKLASVFLNFIFHRYIPDIPSGYKAFNRTAYKKIKWQSSGYEVETEIAARVAKYNIPSETIEIETIYHDKEKGVTPLDALQIMKFLVQLRLNL